MGSFKVAIIGTGHVGSTVAFSLVTQGICDEIVLIDEQQTKAGSEVLDLQDMLPVNPSITHITVGGINDVADADVVVIAVGPKKLLCKDRMEELAETAQAMLSLVPKIIRAGFKGLFLNITNPCDVITALIQKISGFPEKRVFGTGTLLDTARMKRVVGKQLAVCAQSIEGYVLGEHGESQFVAWSTVRLGGKAVLALAENQPIDFDALQCQIRAGGWHILQGKGWTNFGIAACTAGLLRAIGNDAGAVFPVSCYDAQQDCYIGLPAIITREGIRKLLMPALTEQEQMLYQRSAAVIKQALHCVVI